MASIQQEQLLSYLQTANKNNNSRSVYNHIVQVLSVLNRDRPADALATLEELSVQLKNEQFVAGAAAEHREVNDMHASSTEQWRTQVREALQRTEDLMKTSRNAPQQRVQGDDDDAAAAVEEEEEEVEYGSMPDIISQARLLEWAGVSLGEEEAFKLMLAVRQLSGTRDGNIDTVRFFGKVFGTEADYYVCEATLKEYPELEDADAEQNKKVEAPGTGLNAYVYFVCNELGDQWTQLPDVRPEQIQKARYMRRFFTGDLTREVMGFPHFPWSEAAYLRAQLARIAAATVVSPKGFYTVDEESSEEPVVVADEEFESVPTDELRTPEGWVFARPCLLKQGRVQPYEAPEDEQNDDADGDDDEDAEKKNVEEEEEPEEAVALLTPLTDAVKVVKNGGQAADEEADDAGTEVPVWSFGSEPSKPGFPYAVAIARSLQWPGAQCVARDKQFVNVYIGWGHKQLDDAYSPPLPPPVQTEWRAAVDDEDEEEEEEENEDGEVIKKEKPLPQEVQEQEEVREDPNPPEPEEEEEEEEEDEEEEDDE